MLHFNPSLQFYDSILIQQQSWLQILFICIHFSLYNNADRVHRCGYEFCYKCGTEWKKKKATCSCPIWDEHNIEYSNSRWRQFLVQSSFHTWVFGYYSFNSPCSTSPEGFYVLAFLCFSASLLQFSVCCPIPTVLTGLPEFW